MFIFSAVTNLLLKNVTGTFFEICHESLGKCHGHFFQIVKANRQFWKTVTFSQLPAKNSKNSPVQCQKCPRHFLKANFSGAQKFATMKNTSPGHALKSVASVEGERILTRATKLKNPVALQNGKSWIFIQAGGSGLR